MNKHNDSFFTSHDRCMHEKFADCIKQRQERILVVIINNVKLRIPVSEKECKRLVHFKRSKLLPFQKLRFFTDLSGCNITALSITFEIATSKHNF